jgi:predicted ATPase/DNA-binding SARP family transcriptional activator
VEYRILGPLEVVDDGRSIPLGTVKQQALLAVLLLNANEVVPRERLIDELWGERPPATAAKAVQVYVSQLRKRLGEDRSSVATRANGYVLELAPERLDAAQFERRLGEARARAAVGATEDAARLLGDALALWRGRALAGVSFESYASADVERLEELRLVALMERIDCDLELGRHERLIGELERLVAEHPLKERLRAQLMLALYRSGRQAEALVAYRDAREQLVEKLGIEPGDELRALERAVLAHEPTLAGLSSVDADAPIPGLPIPATPLVGRTKELDEAGRLLRAHRLVTLTGAGGSGKTRLAIQLAADAAAEFPDGVFWVPLQALRDPELVLPTITRAVGANDAVVEPLRDRRLLLVLDNFEQLLDAAARLGELLGRLPDLKLLVTSREPLHIAAEYEYPVAPLREREAVTLFMQRATAMKPDFAYDDSIVEICRRLDCLPLALELAAARVKALSVGDLLTRLDRRLPILVGGPQDAPERQRTLRATIAWSYELLTSDEQRLFARLSVFVGGCTLEAAEEVCEAHVDTITALIDKSLLRREGERYSMLETIGEYAVERLEERGELDDLRRRHAEHYVDRARSVEHLIRSPQAAALLDRLEHDHGNLRAALAWFSRGDANRALRLAVWGLAARLHGFGDQALQRRDLGEASRLYRESLEIGLQIKDDLQTAYCLAGLAAVDAQRGRRGLAARLWGSVNSYERTSGTHLHETERLRYERLLGDLERSSDTSADFAAGGTMTLHEAVEYVLANVD